MKSKHNLIKKGGIWEFERESEFEDYLWENLRELMGLLPFKRQYYCQGNFCDILAVNQNKELFIIELKVVEDRYIIQQLTRYYHSLLQEKPFADEINFSQPVHLIAILPKVHKDNLIDATYNKLQIKFITYSIQEEQSSFSIDFFDHIQQSLYVKSEIFIEENYNQNINLPKLPNKLTKIICLCSEEQKKRILNIREKVLCFNPKISENISGDSIIYSAGKTKPIMEIRFDKVRNQPALFLWLPFSSSQVSSYRSRRTLLRIKIWTDWLHVFYLGYIRTGNGVMITREEFKVFPINLIPSSLLPEKQSKFSDLNYHKLMFGYMQNCKQNKLQAFENDEIFREKYVTSIFSFFDHKRKTIECQQHGDPLALTLEQYIELINNRTKKRNMLIVSNKVDLFKTDLTLDDFIDLALYERLL